MKIVWYAVIAVAVVSAGSAFAEPKPNGMDTDGDGKVSKAEYFESRRKIAEKNGEEFNEKATEKKFAGRDKDKDGFLTGEELVKQKKSKKEAQEETGDE